MPVSFRLASRSSAIAALMVCLSNPASAMTVVYNWTPSAGQGGSGSLTFSSPGITDGANFTAVSASALTGLSYTWNNGATINLGSVLTNNAASWTACGGTLITGFQITANAVPATPGTFSLINPFGNCYAGPTASIGSAANAAISASFPIEQNYGNWTYSHTVVPVPAAAWLFGSGVVGLMGLRRRAAS